MPLFQNKNGAKMTIFIQLSTLLDLKLWYFKIIR